jgi:transcriptional regulator with XRE-family HTH domain
MPGRSKRPTVYDRLAAAARRERARLRWTQEEAAEKAGLNIRHYQKIEDGSVNVTLKTVDQLAEAFGVDVADLFG